MISLDERSVLVRHWRITDAHIFPVAELERLIGEYRGQKLTLAELNAVAGRITTYYRQHGYLLSRAYVPAKPSGMAQSKSPSSKGTSPRSTSPTRRRSPGPS
jgi:hemolysin activation/secretion protein